METKHIIRLLVFIPFLLCGCTNHLEQDVTTPSYDKLVVTADFEDNKDTRVSYTEDGALLRVEWEKGDEIELCTRDNQILARYKALNNGKTTSFELLFDSDNSYKEGDTIYATYRSNNLYLWENQPSTTPNLRDFCVAEGVVKNGELNLHFHHAYAYLKLTLPRSVLSQYQEGTRPSIVILSSEEIRPAYEYNWEKKEIIKEDTTNEIFITTSDLGEQDYLVYYIAMLPQSDDAEMTIRLGDGSHQLQRRVPKGGFKAGHIYSIDLLNPGDPVRKDIILSNREVFYGYKAQEFQIKVSAEHLTSDNLPDWITLGECEEQDQGLYLLSLKLSENTTQEIRTAKFRLKTDDDDQMLIVSQNPHYQLIDRSPEKWKDWSWPQTCVNSYLQDDTYVQKFWALIDDPEKLLNVATQQVLDCLFDTTYEIRSNSLNYKQEINIGAERNTSAYFWLSALQIEKLYSDDPQTFYDNLVLDFVIQAIGSFAYYPKGYDHEGYEITVEGSKWQSYTVQALYYYFIGQENWKNSFLWYGPPTDGNYDDDADHFGALLAWMAFHKDKEIIKKFNKSMRVYDPWTLEDGIRYTFSEDADLNALWQEYLNSRSSTDIR